MAKKVLVKDNKVLSLHSGKVLSAPENYDLDTYLNFYMPFGGTITLRRVGSPTVVELEYSTDGGRTWQIWEEVGTDRTLTLPQEGRMWIRNMSETSTRFSLGDNNNYYRFYITDCTYANGNCNSLLCKNSNNAIITSYCFANLFHSTFIVSAPSLPSVIGEIWCYANTFRNTLFKEFTLPFTDAYNRMYSQMFVGSKYLNRIVMYSTRLNVSYPIINWVDGVSPTGDFYCDSNLTIPTGTSGIPTGWTRHDLSELE